MINNFIYLFKLLPFNPLEYGTIKGNQYSNHLINWKLELPKNYSSYLKTRKQRRKDYENYLDPRLMASVKEKNDFIIWTELIYFKNKKTGSFSSKIRKKNQFETLNFQKKLETEAIDLLKSTYQTYRFEYKLFKVKIANQEFEAIEYSKIYQGKTGQNIWATPCVRLMGLVNNIVVYFEIVFGEESDKDEILFCLQHHSNFSH